MSPLLKTQRAHSLIPSFHPHQASPVDLKLYTLEPRQENEAVIDTKDSSTTPPDIVDSIGAGIGLPDPPQTGTIDVDGDGDADIYITVTMKTPSTYVLDPSTVPGGVGHGSRPASIQDGQVVLSPSILVAIILSAVICTTVVVVVFFMRRKGAKKEGVAEKGDSDDDKDSRSPASISFTQAATMLSSKFPAVRTFKLLQRNTSALSTISEGSAATVDDTAVAGRLVKDEK